MTYFVNLRAGPFGSVCDPYVLDGDATADPPTMVSVSWNAISVLTKGKDVLLAAHGFNVSYAKGLASLGHLEAALAMQPNELFLGVLWPGDWVIPAVNYPYASKIASSAGPLLGGFCNRWLSGARSVSFLSHSLGARVVLEAIKASSRPIRQACIAAGAVNANCLAEEFEAAAANCADIRTLSSMQDLVLKLAYPPGDFLADLLDPDHNQLEPALGRGGPPLPYGPGVQPSEIADAPPYDHGDYFPPSLPVLPPPSPADKWRRSVAFMAAVYRSQPPAWP